MLGSVRETELLLQDNRFIIGLPTHTTVEGDQEVKAWKEVLTDQIK